MTQKTSMTYWYPLIEGKLPTPRTEIIPLTQRDIESLMGALDGKRLSKSIEKKLLNTAKHFEYPFFLRTDLTSGKHDFLNTCFVAFESQVLGHSVALMEDTILKDTFATAYVFREFVPLESEFTAFNGLPISKERRYFVDEGKVICHHVYWPAPAIEFWNKKEPKDWREKLNQLNTETPDEIEYLSRFATRFAELVPGAWSVDFAKTKDGRWLLIDAAEAFRSWHPSDCKIVFGEG